MANRLKKCILKLVSESQSAFMSDRLISNNILIAFETLHHLKNRKKGKTGYMALKLDMSKAYDRIEWNFLEKLMEKLGFANKWINLISSCIQSVSFSVMINGEPHGLFHPQRGLRQGDPLSPYLFLLCAEGLHSLIKQAEVRGAIQGVSLCRDGPKITHLFFANDSLLFCKANDQDCTMVMEILEAYERASGSALIGTKLNSILAPTPTIMCKQQSRIGWGYPVLPNLRNILVSLLLLVEQRNKASIISVKGFGIKSNGGKRNSFLKQAKRY